jgi:hypothetical protein
MVKLAIMAKRMKNLRLRISVDEELDAAIMQKMVEECEEGLDVNRAQCLVFFARLGVKAWRNQSAPPPAKNGLGRGDQALVNRLFERKPNAQNNVQ